MENYEEYLNNFRKSKNIYEKSINKDKKEIINRFKNIDSYSQLLKEFDLLINDIKNESKKLSFEDIEYFNNKGELDISYGVKLNDLIAIFKSAIFHNQYNDKLMNYIFDDGERSFYLDITIEPTFNQIHINNGLPNFMKGLGLGKKVYKKLIKDFNCLSSFHGVKPSKESDMVWNTLADDKELYTFVNDDNIICFWNEVDYDIIVNKLREFYINDGQRVFDDDFLKKYDLTDEKLNKIL